MAFESQHVSVQVPLWLIAPFAVLILCVAILPLVAPHWWHSNRNKGVLAGVLALPVAGWLLANGLGDRLGHVGHEYVSFVILLGSLFAISGGVLVEGDLRATPKVNAAFLIVGCAIASFVGTTGASMLLIRPLLRANSGRTRVVHTVVFFIFVVSNCGGCLTPLGDPPLFMGYLRGVPFAWTFTLWPEWLAVNAALIALYFAWDSLAARKETRAALRLDLEHLEPLRVRGGFNLLLLLCVVACVAFVTTSPWLRDGLMVALAAVSVALTPKVIRTRNGFDWFPIVEVAVLFAGIFVTMVPALMVLESRGSELSIDTPREFFWVTGLLSAFLDNAPTYMTFTTVATSVVNAAHPAANVSAANLATLLAAPGGEALLRAISLGAVFLGAMTYIGNGPNFMVKAIAESAGVRMPTFFVFLIYGAAVLIPLLAVVSLLFV